LAERAAQEAKARQEREIQAQKARVMERVQQLGPEPSDGVQLRVRLPDGQPIGRRFGTNLNGEDVYDWVVTQMDDFILNFKLVWGSKELDKDQRLDEQGVIGNTLFMVVLED
jgi:hypothetical protein